MCLCSERAAVMTACCVDPCAMHEATETRNGARGKLHGLAQEVLGGAAAARNPGPGEGIYGAGRSGVRCRHLPL